MLAKQGRGARARFFRVGRVLFARAGSGQAAQPSLHALLPYASPAQAGAQSRRSTSSSAALTMRGPRLGPGLRRGRAEGDVVREGCAWEVLLLRARPVRSGRIGSRCSPPPMPSSLTLPRRRPGPSRAGRRRRALPPPCAAHDWVPAFARPLRTSLDPAFVTPAKAGAVWLSGRGGTAGCGITGFAPLYGGPGLRRGDGQRQRYDVRRGLAFAGEVGEEKRVEQGRMYSSHRQGFPPATLPR